MHYSVDDAATIWINGVQVDFSGSTAFFKSIAIKSFLKPGKNVIAVQAENKFCCHRYFVARLFANTTNGCECDETILKNVVNCSNYTFSVTQNRVNISCFRWTVNGVVKSTASGFSTTLPPGTHTICVYYFGTSKLNPNKICCGVKCITVTIPQVVNQTLNLEYCNWGPGSGVNFRACDYNTGHAYYGFEGILPPVPGMSYTDCNTVHRLTAGTYRVTYYDANGCPVKILTVTVTAKLVQTQYCTKTVVVQCGGSVNLNAAAAGLCPACSTATAQHGNWVNMSNNLVVPGVVNNIQQSAIYRKIITDSANCRKCVIEISVAVQRLVYEQTINIFPSCPCKPFNATDLSIIAGQLNPVCVPALKYWVAEFQNGIYRRTFTVGAGYRNFCDGYDYIIRPAYTPTCCEIKLKMRCYPYIIYFPPVDPVYENNDQYFVTIEPEEDPSAGRTAGQAAVSEKAAAPAALKLTPNPATESFRIQGLPVAAPAAKVTLTDLKGQTLKQWSRVAPNDELQVSGLAAGTYRVLVFTGGRQQALTLVLNR
jgi:hypothetical protein